MKELKLIILFLLLTMTLQGTEEKKIEYTSRIFGTVDIDGAITSQNNLELNNNFGFQIFAEKFYRYSKELEFSYGIGIQMNEGVKNKVLSIEQYYSTPLYISAKYNVFGQALYLKGKIGIPINNYLSFRKKINLTESSEEVEFENNQDVFWGLSIGLDYDIYEWEMTYTINSLEYSYLNKGIREKDTLENIRVSIGYSQKIN